MNLWTWQGRGWDITRGSQRTDASKGPYPHEALVRRACEQLFANLGTDQVVWCCWAENTDSWNLSELYPVLWKLSVPFEAALGVIHTDAWNDLRIRPEDANAWSNLPASLQSAANNIQVLLRFPVDSQWVVQTLDFGHHPNMTTICNVWNADPDNFAGAQMVSH
jgi:hypothetical protein